MASVNIQHRTYVNKELYIELSGLCSVNKLLVLRCNLFQPNLFKNILGNATSDKTMSAGPGHYHTTEQDKKKPASLA